MEEHYLRVYQTFDLEHVNKHLLIVGDLAADCSACKALGLNYREVAQCPECGTVFKFITSRRLGTAPGERYPIVKRIKNARPDLQLVDYDDFQKSMSKKKARDFFG
ncbi:MAG: hypothetical protein A2Z83_02665 [Omnitrophica bacterium GWA2_52_8]|nr:MAG: hypothetical protein A2Z83_02665 [Omnitrophica bacterium GWA2_52_8]